MPPDGVSMSGAGLTVVGGRFCADGEPHEARMELLALAREHGEAEGDCQRCRQRITIKRIGGAE